MIFLKIKFFLSFSTIAIPLALTISCGSSQQFNREELINIYPRTMKTDRTVTVQKVKREFEESLERNEFNQWNIFGINPIPQKFNDLLNIKFKVMNWEITEIRIKIDFMLKNGKTLWINNKAVYKIIDIYGYQKYDF